MKTKTLTQPKPTTQSFSIQELTHNFARPWRPTDIVAGNLILNWHGQEVARVTSARMSPAEAKATRDLIVKAVNVYDAAMRVVNLAALMKHTCTSKPKKVHACNRCLAEVAQARNERAGAR